MDLLSKLLWLIEDEQVHVDEIRKQKTYHAMIEEMEKQRMPMMSTKNILFHQFWDMDKLFFGYYGNFTAERFLRYMAALKALPEEYADLSYHAGNCK